jgi:hypothetical protein
MLAFLASDCQGDGGSVVGVAMWRGRLSVDSMSFCERRVKPPRSPPSGRHTSACRESQYPSRLTARRQSKRGSGALPPRGGRQRRLADRSPGVLTQARDDRRQHMQDGVHLCWRIARAETEPDCPLKPLVSKPYSDEHMRRFEAP